MFFFILAALFLPVNGQLFKNPVSGRGKGLVHFRKFSVYLVMVKVFHDESKNYFVLSKIYRTCVMKLTKDHQWFVTRCPNESEYFEMSHDSISISDVFPRPFLIMRLSFGSFQREFEVKYGEKQHLNRCGRAWYAGNVKMKHTLK